jgi:hypothetical protein
LLGQIYERSSSDAIVTIRMLPPRQGSNKRGIAREKPEKGKPPGAKSGTTKRSGRRGQVKKAKTAKKANGRKRGAR